MQPAKSNANSSTDSQTDVETKAPESTCVDSNQFPIRTEAATISADDLENEAPATAGLEQSVAEHSSPVAKRVMEDSQSHRAVMSPLGGAKGALLLPVEEDTKKGEDEAEDTELDTRDRPSTMSDYQSCDGTSTEEAEDEPECCLRENDKELLNVAAWVDSTKDDNQPAEEATETFLGEDQDDPINFNTEKWIADQRLQEELAKEREVNEKLRNKVEQLERVVQKMNTGRDDLEKSLEARRMDLARKIEELKEKNRRAKEELSKAKSETSNVRSLLQQQKRELSAVRDKLAAQGHKLADAEGQNTLLKEQLEGLQQKMHQKLVRMQSELQALRDDKAHVEVQARELAITQQEHLASFSTVFRSLSLIVRSHLFEVNVQFFFRRPPTCAGSIRVFCRARPLSEAEEKLGAQPAVLLDSDPHGSQMVSVRSAKDGQSKVFEFDRVFSPTTSQAQVFKEAADVITSVLDGYNVCIFAYGQTGTGKTYTMEGPAENRGVSFRTLQELIVVSVLEVYNDTIRDLLAPTGGHAAPNSKKGLEVKQRPEGGNYVPGLVEQEVGSVEEAWKVLMSGSKARATSATSMNEHSSRSHWCVPLHLPASLFLSEFPFPPVRGLPRDVADCDLLLVAFGACSLVCVSVHAQPAAFLRSSKEKEGAGASGASASAGTVSRLWLVDLAGSERVAKSEAEGERLKEAQNINLSLSYLGEVINALAKRASFVNFRNCKLTMLLQDSLEGNAKVLMFVQVSPSEKDSVETVCSLQFACRVRGVDFGASKKQTDVPRLKQALEKAKADCKEVKEAYQKQSEELEEVRRKTATEKEKLVSELQMQIQERQKEYQNLMDALEKEKARALQQAQLQQQQQIKADSYKQPSVSADSLQVASLGTHAEEEKAEHEPHCEASLEQTSEAGQVSASVAAATASSASAASATDDAGMEEASGPRPEPIAEASASESALEEEEKAWVDLKQAGDRVVSQIADFVKGRAGAATGASEKRVGPGRVPARIPAGSSVAGGASAQKAIAAVTASGVPKATARSLGSKIPSSRTGAAWAGCGKGERRREAWDDYAMLGYAPAAKKMMLRRATATDAVGLEVGERLERPEESGAGMDGDQKAFGTELDAVGAVRTRKPGRPPLAGLRVNKVVVGREWYDEWRRQSAEVTKGLKRNPNGSAGAAAEGDKASVACDGEGVDGCDEKKVEEEDVCEQGARQQQLVLHQPYHVFTAGTAAASAAAGEKGHEVTAPLALRHGIPPTAFGSTVRPHAVRRSGLTTPMPSAIPSLHKTLISVMAAKLAAAAVALSARARHTRTPWLGVCSANYPLHPFTPSRNFDSPPHSVPSAAPPAKDSNPATPVSPPSLDWSPERQQQQALSPKAAHFAEPGGGLGAAAVGRRAEAAAGNAVTVEPGASRQRSHGVHVFQCKDRLGIVARISECVASRHANLLNVDLHIDFEAPTPIFYSRSLLPPVIPLAPPPTPHPPIPSTLRSPTSPFPCPLSPPSPPLPHFPFPCPLSPPSPPLPHFPFPCPLSPPSPPLPHFPLPLPPISPISPTSPLPPSPAPYLPHLPHFPTSPFPCPLSPPSPPLPHFPLPLPPISPIPPLPHFPLPLPPISPISPTSPLPPSPAPYLPHLPPLPHFPLPLPPISPISPTSPLPPSPAPYLPHLPPLPHFPLPLPPISPISPTSPTSPFPCPLSPPSPPPSPHFPPSPAPYLPHLPPHFPTSPFPCPLSPHLPHFPTSPLPLPPISPISPTSPLPPSPAPYLPHLPHFPTSPFPCPLSPPSPPLSPLPPSPAPYLPPSPPLPPLPLPLPPISPISPHSPLPPSPSPAPISPISPLPHFPLPCPLSPPSPPLPHFPLPLPPISPISPTSPLPPSPAPISPIPHSPTSPLPPFLPLPPISPISPTSPLPPSPAPYLPHLPTLPHFPFPCPYLPHLPHFPTSPFPLPPISPSPPLPPHSPFPCPLSPPSPPLPHFPLPLPPISPISPTSPLPPSLPPISPISPTSPLPLPSPFPCPLSPHLPHFPTSLPLPLPPISPISPTSPLPPPPPLCSEFSFDPARWPRQQMQEDFAALGAELGAERSNVHVMAQDKRLRMAVLVSQQVRGGGESWVGGSSAGRGAGSGEVEGARHRTGQAPAHGRAGVTAEGGELGLERSKVHVMAQDKRLRMAVLVSQQVGWKVEGGGVGVGRGFGRGGWVGWEG
ncbi:unnamed protein product [Closterium sp. Yama58-4]|nr:unnamed protein product [Closterium sp. Yama58-4]